MDRRRFVKNITLGSSAAALTACVSKPFKSNVFPAKKRLYIDGLSFIPTNHADVKASGMDAFIADISAIESITRPDGSINYKRTYNACMKSIKEKKADLRTSPNIFHVADKGSDIFKAQNENKCAVFFQIQGADCVEGGLHQVDEFYDLGLRVL